MEDLLEYNARGILPLPHETIEQYRARAESIDDFANEMKSQAEIDRCKADLHRFDLCVDWLPILYRQKGLSFWEGGACWIGKWQEISRHFSLKSTMENERCFCVVQIHPKLAQNKKYWFCHLDEVIEHEAIHAARLEFSEPRFEEMLAYQSSRSRWRKIVGALFRSPKEVFFFTAILIGSIGMQILALFWNLPFFSSFFLFLPWGILAGLIIRLLRDRKIFARAYRRLEKALSIDPFALLVRLTDREIVSISQCPENDIPDWMSKKRKESWRWDLFYRAYFLRNRAEGIES